MRETEYRRLLLASLCLCVLFFGLSPATADDEQPKVSALPKAGEVFPTLMADPREILLYASYYRHDGQNDADVALGHSWGMTRWRSGILQEWLWELDLEAMAYSRFKIGGGVNKVENLDFFSHPPTTLRPGDPSFQRVIFP